MRARSVLDSPNRPRANGRRFTCLGCGAVLMVNVGLAAVPFCRKCGRTMRQAPAPAWPEVRQ